MTADKWEEYIDAGDAWTYHSETCDQCTDHRDEDDIWRIELTDTCTKGKQYIDRIRQIEIELGIVPTNR